MPCSSLVRFTTIAHARSAQRGYMLSDTLKTQAAQARHNNTLQLQILLKQKAQQQAKLGYDSASVLFNEPIDFVWVEWFFKTQGCTVTAKPSSFGTTYTITW